MSDYANDPNFFTKSSQWVSNINYMHRAFKVHDAIKDMDIEKLRALLSFRVNFIREEFNELVEATAEQNAEEVVDALIDLCVVAIGTLDLMGVDADKAWAQVYQANISKETGIKPERPNPLGLPDLIKPTGWQAPSHEGNHGILTEIFNPSEKKWDEGICDWQLDMFNGNAK
jgi:predicted HAD superfamily Cof-like phosphohydrolase